MVDKKLPQKWDEEADIIIVGSGFAGLAAAIETKDSRIYKLTFNRAYYLIKATIFA
jgi:thioredoxin reductase